MNNKKSNENQGKGTFIVRVEYCQNETWQGKVTWADKDKSMHFRSALELVKLMNEALEHSQTASSDISKHSVS
jgi:hypothetical protein